jgi:hypothetical protein
MTLFLSLMSLLCKSSGKIHISTLFIIHAVYYIIHLFFLYLCLSLVINFRFMEYHTIPEMLGVKGKGSLGYHREA